MVQHPSFRDAFKVPPPLEATPVDLVIVYDTTGSMTHVWPDLLKKALGQVIQDLMRNTPSLRVGTIKYRASDPRKTLTVRFAAIETLNAALDEAAQNRRLFRCGRPHGWSRAAIFCAGPPHAAVHGQVGEAVGALVLFAQHMLDLKAFEAGNAPLGLFIKGTQFRAVHLVLSLDLLHHQLRVGDYFQARMSLGKGEIEGGQQAGVFGVVVGVLTEIFAQLPHHFAACALDEDSKAGGAGIAA